MLIHIRSDFHNRAKFHQITIKISLKLDDVSLKLKVLREEVVNMLQLWSFHSLCVDIFSDRLVLMWVFDLGSLLVSMCIVVSLSRFCISALCVCLCVVWTVCDVASGCSRTSSVAPVDCIPLLSNLWYWSHQTLGGREVQMEEKRRKQAALNLLQNGDLT